ncbi:hypothetical protein V5O48_016078 [Marasmius crinis-equi]|uniref:Nucleotidyltransferase family protein n=1 Tax=Marasmius crinis-equi TaxID=585013 RepID=A0ABR3ESP9_9AGAR
MPPPLKAFPSREPQIPFTINEIRQIARRTIRLIDEVGYGCYLFGSAACHSYCYTNQTPRIPKDLDFVVFDPQNTVDAEALKKEIERRDERFYRVKAKDPKATHHPFWFSFSSPPDLTRSIKIDLVPSGVKGSILKIPDIPAGELVTLQARSMRDIRLMPLVALLIMKLKGWRDHRLAPKRRLWRKMFQDVEDIHNLIIESVRRNETITSAESYLPARFIKRGKADAKYFLRKNPEVREDRVMMRRWVKVGLVKPN